MPLLFPAQLRILELGVQAAQANEALRAIGCLPLLETLLLNIEIDASTPALASALDFSPLSHLVSLREFEFPMERRRRVRQLRS